MPRAVDPRLLDDYKIHVQALANHYGRLWTRFNFFITIQTALMVALVGLFKDTGLIWAAIPIPMLGALISALWYVTGAQDRYLVRFYREMISHAAARLAPDDDEWAHPGLEVPRAVRLLAVAKRRELGPHAEETDEELLGLRRTRLQWRSERLSVTRLPALVPMMIGGLWVMAVLGVGVAAAF